MRTKRRLSRNGRSICSAICDSSLRAAGWKPVSGIVRHKLAPSSRNNAAPTTTGRGILICERAAREGEANAPNDLRQQNHGESRNQRFEQEAATGQQNTEDHGKAPAV